MTEAQFGLIQEQLNVNEKLFFDGGNFTIKYFTDSPNGFQINTYESLPRHLPNTPLPYAKRIREKRDDEPKKYRIGEKFTPKIGIRDIVQEGNLLSLKTKPVTYPTVMAINNSMESEEALDASTPSSISAILMTTEEDKSHKIIIQIRHLNNSFYPGNPGASVAGFLDGKLDHQNKGKLIPINTEYLNSKLEKEIEEELGIKPENINNLPINGIVSAKTLVHNEFVASGILNLTSEQLANVVKKRSAENRPDDNLDFEGNYFLIKADPESIELLLTDCLIPLAPAHAGSLVTAGYKLAKSKYGTEKANIWLKDLETGYKNNLNKINSTVKEFWINNPNKISLKPENKPARVINSYDPNYPAQEQGLPDLKSELDRIGILEF